MRGAGLDEREVRSLADDLGHAAKAWLGHPSAFATTRRESLADHGVPPQSYRTFRSAASPLPSLSAMPTSICEE